MRRACIDIGSNTTRLLVAECDGERLQEVHQERVFTRIGRGLRIEGALTDAKVREVVAVVTAQLRVARDLGAVDVRAVATAAIRGARNGGALTDAILADCGLRIDVLSGEEEARLAFVGAARTLGHVPDGQLGVVDVGGGSSEIVVGIAPDSVSWSRSFSLGSDELTERCLPSDPPAARELAAARSEVAATVGAVAVPQPCEAVAVGGSATSLRRLTGPLLDAETFARTLALLASERAAVIARRFALDAERVRLLPAGLLILQAASEVLGASLQIGFGGVREGLLLEASP